MPPKDHWWGFSTWSAHMVHSVNWISAFRIVQVSLCVSAWIKALGPRKQLKLTGISRTWFRDTWRKFCYFMTLWRKKFENDVKIWVIQKIELRASYIMNIIYTFTSDESNLSILQAKKRKRAERFGLTWKKTFYQIWQQFYKEACKKWQMILFGIRIACDPIGWKV